ncbi:MAG TPA: CoA pyrophosphatase, partial [Actinobacteria bacterium]|nr:CoA pyrophosphatase [Actinomycetota bacterium]
LEALGPVVDRPDARAAVLVPLYEADGGVRVILTRRPDEMRTHPGDVVFPGGRIEPGETPLDTALRETTEEIGLPPDHVVEILGGLEPLTTRDRERWIVPVVAKVRRPERLVPDPAEVAAIIEPTLVELMDETRWRRADWRGRPLWFFEFPEGTLWGATARMVRELLGYLR